MMMSVVFFGVVGKRALREAGVESALDAPVVPTGTGEDDDEGGENNGDGGDTRRGRMLTNLDDRSRRIDASTASFINDSSIITTETHSLLRSRSPSTAGGRRVSSERVVSATADVSVDIDITDSDMDDLSNQLNRDSLGISNNSGYTREERMLLKRTLIASVSFILVGLPMVQLFVA